MKKKIVICSRLEHVLHTIMSRLTYFREKPRVTIVTFMKERIKTRYSSLIQLHAVIAHAEAANKNVIQYRSKKRKYNHSLSSHRDGR